MAPRPASAARNCPARNGVETWGAYETADGRPPARPAPTRSSPLLGRILRCTPDGARRRRSGGARRRPGCRGCDRRPRGGGGDRFAVGRSGGLERLTHLPHGERGVDAAPRRARAGRGASATLWPTGGRARRVLRDHAFPRRSRRASGHRRGEGGGAGRASVWRRAGQIIPGGIGVHQGYVEIVAPEAPPSASVDKSSRSATSAWSARSTGRCKRGASTPCASRVRRRTSRTSSSAR